MGAEELKQALKDCVINFDAKVLVTDLLQDYQMPYADVDKILSEHIAKEEKKGHKFDKRFLVSGEEESTTNEIYKVVNSESDLKEWLSKLKNAESALYSVEIKGGAKPAADIFVPMRWCPIQIKNIEIREPLVYATKGAASTTAKVEAKPEQKKPKKGYDFTANAKQQTSTTASKPVNGQGKDIKKSPTTTTEKQKTPKKQISPVEQKPAVNTKGNAKKGIASFFAAAKPEDKTKKNSGVIKPPSPKKMQDFFKKADKTAPPSKANESVQLFENDDDEDENEEEDEDEKMSAEIAVSSDDEAEIEALRQKCKEEPDAEPTTSNKKRRRIIDSDDDDDDNDGPQVKQEKKDESSECTESNGVNGSQQSETYLDEDGFVITVKAKKSAATATKKPEKVPSPQKSSPKKADDKKPAKTTPKASAKTKQGNIMSFFTKKGF